MTYLVWLIKYLGFRIWLWFLFSLCLNFMWKGGDGLIIKATSWEIKNYSLNDIEKDGVGSSRYVAIKNAIRGDSYVYTKRLGMIESVLYPIISQERLSELAKINMENQEKTEDLLSLTTSNPNLKIRAVVKMPVSFSEDKIESWANEYLAREEGELEGIVLKGWDAFDTDDSKLLIGMRIGLHDDLIIIEKGKEPPLIYISLIYLIGGALLYIILFIEPYHQHLNRKSERKNESAQ
jgi:hypothetical protein